MSADLCRENHVVAILGCGFMGTALLSGIFSSKSSDEGFVKKYYACVRRQDHADRLRTRFSQHGEVEVVCNDNLRALHAADVVILGFRPGDVTSILGDTEISKALEGKLIVSMLAGVATTMIYNILSAEKVFSNVDRESCVVRVIPSIGAHINEACSLISEMRLAPSAMFLVEWLFSQVGSIQIMPEGLLNTAVVISATSHALAITAVDALTDGSVSRGMPGQDALKLVAQCLRSASGLLLEKMTLEDLKDAISVPRRITTEAWIQLDAGHVRSAVSQSVRHAVDYSERMR